MNAKATISPVAPDEVARRLAEYRRLGIERKIPPQVVYQGPHCCCPWPDCAYRIDGIQFVLEQWAEPADLDRFLNSWWRGPGLVGCCPGCRRPVLFSISAKAAVSDLRAFPDAVLPQDWQNKVHLVHKSDE